MGRGSVTTIGQEAAGRHYSGTGSAGRYYLHRLVVFYTYWQTQRGWAGFGCSGYGKSIYYSRTNGAPCFGTNAGSRGGTNAGACSGTNAGSRGQGSLYRRRHPAAYLYRHPPRSLRPRRQRQGTCREAGDRKRQREMYPWSLPKSRSR